LTVRLPGVDAARRRVVLAPRLELDPRARIFLREGASASRTRVYVGTGCEEAAIARFRDVAEVVPVAHDVNGLDLSAVLADLLQLGVQAVLVEGGGKTSGAFLSRGLVDEIVLFIAGRLFGTGDATPVLDLPAALSPETAWRVAEAAFIPIGRDLVVVGRPEAP
jgi:diaminohydroxyphosphoribosylaminopyrimidine deaminase/5-amino-6-(5-phosphoribosylamino)uracil reductase